MIISSSPLLKKPNSKTMDTEVLYGESLELLEIKNKWGYCQLLDDKYKGWININHLGELPRANSKVSVNRTFVYELPSIKSKIYTHLTLNSKININQYNNTWSTINLNPEISFNKGYVLNSHTLNINHVIEDWVSVAEKLVGTPYRWGGKDTIGFDCSALVQISIANSGINFPRDTALQKKARLNIKNSYSSFSRGMLVFWEGHVGIMLDDNYIIHANEFYMSTVIEKVENVIERALENKKEITHILEIKS
ncbi:C40 family peptidase [Alphaproteobacteria bacterium]|nr:C40 family peptidase [Alphaproteobacteria bacterium]